VLIFLLACGRSVPAEKPDAGGVDSPADSSVDTSADSPADSSVDTSDTSTVSDPDTTVTDTAPDTAETGPTDLDGDGLADDDEARIAADYLPFLALSPDDGCAVMGILYRASPHPLDPTRVHVVYDLLYDEDCGAGGHVGDDEVFAVTIDPARPAPHGILAMVAIAHQDTACEETTECGCGDGMDACDTVAWHGEAWPAVHPSRDKHGNYLFDDVCDGACVFTNWCDEASEPPAPVLVNAGEPDRPMTNDLTASGLVTVENGWTNAELFDYDPWSGEEFGGAGSVANDLVDEAFDTPVPECD
jgi:hypothetical protein